LRNAFQWVLDSEIGQKSNSHERVNNSVSATCRVIWDEKRSSVNVKDRGPALTLRRCWSSS
jgi:hypothetical protein